MSAGQEQSDQASVDDNWTGISHPRITRTTHVLPFDKLSPRDFERLCLWLVEREGYERAEYLGAAGSEQGRDVVAWQEGELWAFQCKRVRSFGPKNALKEIEKVLNLPQDQRPVGLVFLITCNVSANTRQKAHARCKQAGLKCHFWVGAELDEKVKRHPDIKQEFFGSPIREVFQAVVSPWGLAVLAVGLILAFVLAAGIFNIPTLLGLLPTPMAFEPARADETLVIIAPFAGSLSDFKIFPERYIRDALRERVDRLNMAGTPARLEMWTAPLATQREARAVGEAYSATLVIWGEFDDVGGIRTFVEIMHEVPQPDIEQSGNWLPLVMLPSEQAEISHVSRDCLVEGVPRQADYLATLSLGMIQLIHQRRDQAEELFTRAIESVQSKGDCQQDAHQAYYWRGLVRGLQEHFPEALDDLNQALRLNPEFKLALAQRGIVHLAIGRADAAQADFEAALALTYPEDQANRAALLGNIGLALELQGELDQALEHYQQSWQINQESDDMIAQALDLGHFGSLYQRKGQLEVALNYHTQALTLCQQTNFRQGEAVALGNIGLIYYQQQDYDNALRFYQEALTIDEAIKYSLGQARQLIRIGLVYLKQQEPETALQFFNQSLALYETAGSLYGQAQAQIGIGLAENQRGNTTVALSRLQEALRLLETIGSPDAEVVHRAIEQVQP